MKGTITVHSCRDRSTGAFFAADACQNKEGGSWILFQKIDVENAGSQASFLRAIDGTVGVRVK